MNSHAELRAEVTRNGVVIDYDTCGCVTRQLPNDSSLWTVHAEDCPRYAQSNR